MKTSVNTYSFARVRKSDGTPLNAVEMCDLAKELGFDAIEFVGLDVPGSFNMTQNQFAYFIRGYCAAKGLGISAYTVGADFLAPGTVEHLKHELDVAFALGAPLMRHDIAYSCPEGRTYFDLIPEFAEKVTEVTEYAKTLGVRTCTENHGYFSQDSDRMTALVKAVNNPNFGLLVDFGNFMCADQISVEAVKETAPYAIHVHAKDFHYVPKEESVNPPAGYFNTRGGNHISGCALGDGVVNVRECVNIMKKAGYSGFITLEYEGPFGDPVEEIRRGLAFLKSCIA
ncbi:MAG: sugar phosphate isomerase/epimerase [Clostridia bacterium]|nr:sugar phosphate isomerase/epimerase [Clostridia bacterium]